MFSLPTIRLHPDPILARETKYVDASEWGSVVPSVERDLRTAMQAYPAVGFAANQLGHDAQVFIMVRADDTYQVFVNPEIVYASSQSMEDWEGCMSIPDKKALVVRPLMVRIAYRVGPKKPKKVITLHDYEARIACHEIDHLKGITILDRALAVEDVEREEPV